MQPSTPPASSTSVRLPGFVYAGIALVALATLMDEILLTRIFSVTMLYHFAFVAISVAMFGMTLGALVVYLLPQTFRPERTIPHVTAASIAFALVLVFSFLTQLSIPFHIYPSVVSVYAIGLTYVVISLPFILSGIAITLMLTRFRPQVGRLYAADLCGAAAGCLLIVPAIGWTDAVTAMLITALAAAAGATCFATAARSRPLRRAAWLTVVLLALAVAGNTAFVWRGFPIFRILYIRGALEARPLYEKWNSYSRVRVNGDPNRDMVPTGWGLSTRLDPAARTRQLQMDIDVAAGTVMTRFDGNPSSVAHLRDDVTNIGYYIRQQPRVLVVGAGGGRDVLSAITFSAAHVTAVEINKDVLATVNRRFGDFTGHLDRRADVTVVNDEARSFIARQHDRFDILQISLIDTWAATAAGAFVLSENSLYTSEAWQLFLSRLSDHGILSVSRWYFRERPGEIYRLLSLAADAMSKSGFTDLRQHVVIVRNMQIANRPDLPDGVGTLLLSRAAFTAAELDTLDAVAHRLAFDVVLSPRVSDDPLFTTLLDPVVGREAARAYPINITAPTDNSPFFFNMLRLRDLAHWRLLNAGKQTQNMTAVFVLGVLLVIVVVLTSLCLVVPLWIGGGNVEMTGSGTLFGYFAAIGAGFMLFETSQMQRLIIVLGHPTYGLTVVLFALLLSSGAGSYLTGGMRRDASWRSAAVVRLGALVGILLLFGWLTPPVSRVFEAATTPVRIAAAVALLAPPGLFMGMAFPIGMRLAEEKSPRLTPWLWGINGAVSVLASVLSACIALTWSISAAFWTATACYALAWICLVATANRESTAGSAAIPA